MLIVDREGKLLTKLYFPEKFVTAPQFGETEAQLFVTAPGNNTDPPFVGKVYAVANPVHKQH